jgi:hypothetical protein
VRAFSFTSSLIIFSPFLLTYYGGVGYIKTINKN